MKSTTCVLLLLCLAVAVSLVPTGFAVVTKTINVNGNQTSQSYGSAQVDVTASLDKIGRPKRRVSYAGTSLFLPTERHDDLLHTRFEVFDIVGCFMDNKGVYVNSLQHFALVLDPANGEVNPDRVQLIEFSLTENKDKTSWNSIGTMDNITLRAFNSRYKHGCEIIRNPYPVILGSISDKVTLEKTKNTYRKWLQYGNKRLKEFASSNWKYDLSSCNCQHTIMYVVYGFGDFHKNIYRIMPQCRKADDPTVGLINTSRSFWNALNDHCYIRFQAKGLTNPMYSDSFSITHEDPCHTPLYEPNILCQYEEFDITEECAEYRKKTDSTFLNEERKKSDQQRKEIIERIRSGNDESGGFWSTLWQRIDDFMT